MFKSYIDKVLINSSNMMPYFKCVKKCILLNVMWLFVNIKKSRKKIFLTGQVFYLGIFVRLMCKADRSD